MIYPWQTDDWAHLDQLRASWPHALLLHGRAGIGKLQFAQHLAQSLLCESPTATREPCGHCVACLWFSQGNHPDYRAVLPEVLAGELIGDDKPDADEGKKTKVPSKEIKIDQVLGLMNFFSLGSHRGGARVVLIYPAESINVFAANALLKTLEEPPAGVVFILVTARIDRLLPTIISRCRQWPMTLPAAEPSVAWLAQQGVQQPATLLAEAGGAPLTALALANDENRALRDFALAQLAAGPGCDAFACGENLQKLPVPMVLGWLQRWLYDLLAQKTAGRPRYFPAASKALERCAAQIDADRFSRYQKLVTRQRAVENHPLNARLVFEELFLGYRDVFNAA
ncbi:DNA polymerase III subunit delta' [Burkholderia sp. Leaf177]|uniref:DNA polymerase III subunit delta' n=1 Tax=Burkholderia sp. Leaf177 TaxID=1736287 RepID=UPI0006FB8315|nr:DNA polymerase III subunit delta' [Burkholderia sp. Leaf177]KQR87151.1 DNA polymerase III subunit delta' [Burkholderia sp. Leaf177]